MMENSIKGQGIRNLLKTHEDNMQWSGFPLNPALQMQVPVWNDVLHWAFKPHFWMKHAFTQEPDWHKSVAGQSSCTLHSDWDTTEKKHAIIKYKKTWQLTLYLFYIHHYNQLLCQEDIYK